MSHVIVPLRVKIEMFSIVDGNPAKWIISND